MVQGRPGHQYWYRRAMSMLIALALILVCVPPQVASAVDEGDGWLGYGINNVNTAPTKEYSSGTWSSANDIVGTDTQSVRFTRMIASPTESEMMYVYSDSAGEYRVHRWNGTSWEFEWSDFGGGSNSSAHVPRVDIAYANNGDAVVFYSDNSTGTREIRYRTYNNSTNAWSGVQDYDTIRTTADVRMVRVINVSGTDQFVIAWNDINMDLSANYYDLSSNSFSGEPATALSTDLAFAVTSPDPRSRNFDLTIESSSKEPLICWSEESITDLKCISRGAGTGGSWGSILTYTTFANKNYDMQMAADPNSSSDLIAFCGTNGTELEIGRWSGSGWLRSIGDSSVDSSDNITTNCAVEWTRSGSTSQAVVTFDDLNDAGIDWMTYDPGTDSWTTQLDHVGAFSPAAGNDEFHEITRNSLDTDELMVVVIDANSDLVVKKLTFDGSSFSWTSADDGGSSHNTNQNNHGGWTAAFAFYGYGVTPTLSVDIVDSGGSSVASPSVSMSAVTSGNTCQTPTGTLGVSSQKIRITNTTSNPAWTLTVAATGGATANWSATTYTYDYNDSSGSGCADGADADSLAGQLTINASGGTRAAQSGCSTTGVTLGSSSAFVEGTTNSITVLSASGSADTGCYWDLTDVNLSQKIPAYQEPGSYSLQLTLTLTAN